MNAEVQITGYREDRTGTDLIIHIPEQISELLVNKGIRSAEIRLDDGRQISAAQRKKIYATIRDIAGYTGYMPEEEKEWLKYLHISRTGEAYFSLSTCSMDTAREFINTILEYAIEHGIPLSERGVERADDIGKYLFYCIKHKKCAVCGRDGEIHHVDAIGMGRDRRTVDDSSCRKLCLCRTHHTIAHQRGMRAFEQMYHVYGIVIPEDSRSPMLGALNDISQFVTL
ncbi:putative HNHc nuclease [Blautia coccoides]|uniref:putative HNHc nuclease n=1 Tax=Blautia producta TaxID=33035 RepID=UPI0028A437D9|nr:putative HNHc nuclease [Blautia coccoides]MDT4375467.1 putative HNHc nuclease [Blautia coccoides]